MGYKNSPCGSTLKGQKFVPFKKSETGRTTGIKTGIYIMDKNFEDGIVLAKELFAALDARGKKWKNRNVPVYVRDNLWIPYYITEMDGVKRVYVIRPPDPQNPKVHFREY